MDGKFRYKIELCVGDSVDWPVYFTNEVRIDDGTIYFCPYDAHIRIMFHGSFLATEREGNYEARIPKCYGGEE